MNEWDEILFRALTKDKLSRWLDTLPSTDDIENDIARELTSAYPLVPLGRTAEHATFNITEEERTHTHILGLPGQGKSKLLELFMRHDVDRLLKDKSAPGFCLIDSSDFGNTCNKMLRYCREKGFKKIIIIDPNDMRNPVIGKVPAINIFGKLVEREAGMLRYSVSKHEAVAKVRNTLRILWESDGFAMEARINLFLRALTEVLWEANGTLSDLIYFTAKSNEQYESKRKYMIQRLRENDQARVTLEEVFQHMPPHVFQTEFGSTIRRLNPIFEGNLPLFLGSHVDAIDFPKLLGDGWIVLANLDPKSWDLPQQRFLGTLIIQEVISAQYQLVARGRKIPLFLYVDEVGRYATETLSELIDYKRTSNLKLVVAHQRYSQIKNKNVMDGISSSQFKVLFYADPDDRDRMLKTMFYGKMKEKASEAFHDLEVQHAVVKVGKIPPRKIRLLDIGEIAENEDKDLEFKKELYRQPWYKTRAQVIGQMNARFVRSVVHGPSAEYASKRVPEQKTKKSKGTDRKGTVGATRGRAKRKEDPGSAQRNGVPDNPPRRPPLLPDET